VISAEVNIATNKASIEYNPTVIRLSEIKQRIIKAGYTPLSIEKVKEPNQLVNEQKKMWRDFIIAVVFTVPLLYIAMGPMIGLPIIPGLSPMKNQVVFAIVQFILTIPVVVVGKHFYTKGFKALWKRLPNMDSLIAVGTTAAILYSLYATVMIFLGEMSYVESLYFETAATIITLIKLGKTLEHRSKGRTSAAIEKLIDLQPKTAMVLHGETSIELPVEEVEVGDVVLIKPGSSVPVDGLVIEGESSVDESMLTGESLPVDKKIDSKVVAASINKNGSLKVAVTATNDQTVLSKIITLVEDAQGKKAPIARMADIISGYFVPVVIGIALVSFLLWFIFGGDFTFSLKIFISILVIACPCALGLATPTAIMVSTGRSAEYGVLIKSGEALEQTHLVDQVVLDKTGTITEGKMRVTNVMTEDISEELLIMYAASAEQNSEHPLAVAVLDYAKDMAIDLKPVTGFKAIPGKGLEGHVEGKKITIGNEAMMMDLSISINLPWEVYASEGKTPVFVLVDNVLVGFIAIGDTIKATSLKAVQSLQKMGIKVTMITGDNQKTAQAIAKEVGIDDVLAEVLPKDKADAVKSLQEHHIVAMVGDGINDAPALVQADVGIAIGSGTDVAIEAADVVLIKNNLEDVVTAIKLSRMTIRNIKQNLFWAFFYNIIGIPVAAGVLTFFDGPLLNPMFAAAAMSLSSVSVVSNALRLKRIKI
jgi:Cu+-exporting ATPase